MLLPDTVKNCIDALESRGYPTYAVGGCVRDHLLGLQPHDFDLCTAATPEQMQEVFSGCRLVLAGIKHGTVGVVTDDGVVEITTFRTEGSYQDNRHPDWVNFVTSIDEDLARRDFTVNAMAWSPTRGLQDPFGGRNDLQNRILRAVGQPERRFREDALRILRGVRFAVRYRLTPESSTQRAMFALAPLMENLARERVFEELSKLLPLIDSAQLLAFAPVITQVIPELKSAIGFQQQNPHHAYDVFTHISHVVENAPADPALRWAALLHDVGKPQTFSVDDSGCGHFYGHAGVSAQVAEDILRRLKAPNALRQEVVQLIAFHMLEMYPDRKLLRRRVSQHGMDFIQKLLQLMEADTSSKGVRKDTEVARFRDMRNILQEIREENACLRLKDLAVNGRDLINLGFAPGPEIGACLEQLLSEVLDEQLPNQSDALLLRAKALLKG